MKSPSLTTDEKTLHVLCNWMLRSMETAIHTPCLLDICYVTKHRFRALISEQARPLPLSFPHDYFSSWLRWRQMNTLPPAFLSRRLLHLLCEHKEFGLPSGFSLHLSLHIANSVQHVRDLMPLSRPPRPREQLGTSPAQSRRALKMLAVSIQHCRVS